MKIEFENAIKKLRFLCCITDIKIAQINPCKWSIKAGGILDFQKEGDPRRGSVIQKWGGINLLTNNGFEPATF